MGGDGGGWGGRRLSSRRLSSRGDLDRDLEGDRGRRLSSSDDRGGDGDDGFARDRDRDWERALGDLVREVSIGDFDRDSDVDCATDGDGLRGVGVGGVRDREEYDRAEAGERERDTDRECERDRGGRLDALTLFTDDRLVLSEL